ncbi:MAG: hypothetical protein OEM25_00195 [Gammaproteobacteria bacterium]|nr:hypothetical protein [Gammaproteobacteria bacterium]
MSMNLVWRKAPDWAARRNPPEPPEPIIIGTACVNGYCGAANRPKLVNLVLLESFFDDVRPSALLVTRVTKRLSQLADD